MTNLKKILATLCICAEYDGILTWLIALICT